MLFGADYLAAYAQETAVLFLGLNFFNLLNTTTAMLANLYMIRQLFY
jgi:hypothetical protein